MFGPFMDRDASIVAANLAINAANLDANLEQVGIMRGEKVFEEKVVSLLEQILAELRGGKDGCAR